MKKSELRDLIIKHQKELINDLEQSIKKLSDASDMDEDALKDSEDFSHQNESKEMERRINEQLKIAKADLSIIQNCAEKSFGAVQFGALVETDKNNFYVCIATAPFEVSGKNVIGISDHAPIFYKMKGKKLGESFEMANITYKILSIS
jgi:hypothetical protein